MTEVLPLNVFLATPGDAEREREIVHSAVKEWNARRASSGVQFEVIGWERVRGTARRPQQAINELIAESHFLLAVFKERWGTEPGSSWGYTSGTEEELFCGLLELGQADQPMRDVWIAFMDSPAPQPPVTELKTQLIDKHSMLFESISDVADLKEKVTARLDGWEASAAVKTPRHVELVSSTGSEILRAARLRVDGEKLVELGHAEAGLASLRESAEIGGPLELLTLARYLARQGDLDEAHLATQTAIDKARDSDSGLFSTMAAETFAAQAGVLRRRGEHVEAVGRLGQALTLVSADDADARRVRCRILDEIGLARKAAKDLGRARTVFEQALELRREAGVPTEICQSLINLARLAVEDRDLATARQHSDEALMILENIAPTALHANAETLAAQVRLRQGDASDAIEHAQRARALNEQFGSANGEAIALHVLAQCYRAAGVLAQAAESAQACLAINQRIGNSGGMAQAQWQIDAISAEAEARDS